MATNYLIQDPKISTQEDGASLVGNNGGKALKKGGGIGGRKALNDISNSAKPLGLQASKKTNFVIIGKGGDATTNKFSVANKDNFPKGLAKKGSRKALTDLTNSSKSSTQQAAKKRLDENIPTSVAEEQFLHNHHKCIKAQGKAMDLGCFLKEVGLDGADIPVHLAASPPVHKLSTKSQSPICQPKTPVKYFEVEEMPEVMLYDNATGFGETETCGYSLPSEASTPISASPPYRCWNDESAVHFTLIGTP